MKTRRRATVPILTAMLLALLHAGDAEDATSHLQLGRQSYDNGQYDHALEHLRQAFSESPGNVEINMLLGLSALAAHDYETAAAAFDRVLAMRPDLDRARLELARTYYHLQLYSVAEDLFREVAEKPETPDSVRQNIRGYLRQIDRATRTHHFSGALSLTVVRDSNARVSPEGAIDLPGLPPLDVPIERDWFLAQSLVLEHRWKPRARPYAWQTSLLAYNAFYETEDDLDVNYLRLDSGPVRGFGRWSAGVAANAAFMEKDYDRYLGTVGGRVWSAAEVSQAMIVRMEWRGERRRYWQDSDADGFSHTLSVRPTYAVGPHTLVADLGVETHDADTGDETYDKWFATLAYQLSLPWAMSLRSAYTYENWHFEDPAVFTDERRRDHVHQVSLAVRKLITRQVAVDLKHAYENSHSNNDLYDYNRNVTSLSLTLAF